MINAHPNPQAPPLAGALAPDDQDVPRGRRRRQEGPFTFLSAAAFHEPVIAGRTPFGAWILVSDPAGVRRVLVERAADYPKSSMDTAFFAAIFGGGLLGLDGEDWRRHRRIMAPAFDPRSIGAYGPAMAATIAAFRRRWDSLPDGAAIDMVHEMTELALDVISRTVFSVDSGRMSGLVRDVVAQGLVSAAQANVLDLLPVVGRWRMARRQRRMARASAGLDQAIEQVLAERAAAGAQERPADLIDRLIAARDAEGGGGLSAKEIRDEIVTIYIAGHETTASTLAWAWYALSQRPSVLERLHAELDRTVQDRLPTTDDLAKLAFTRQVVEESLRLYPAAPGLSTRRARCDDEICGVKIPKGAAVNVLPWVLHRHRRLWENPDEFDPDRFAPEASAERPRFAWLPFGAGPRVCIGQVLAMQEASLALAALAQRHFVRLDPKADVAPRANVTLQFKHGLPMTLHRRPAPAVSAAPAPVEATAGG